ncbi:hypothetical protein BgiMline_021426 [Biomphalaria glabrata]|nr:hypothetical protein BgiMline_032051 [Biomphalaria glabrata]
MTLVLVLVVCLAVQALALPGFPGKRSNKESVSVENFDSRSLESVSVEDFNSRSLESVSVEDLESVDKRRSQESVDKRSSEESLDNSSTEDTPLVMH